MARISATLLRNVFARVMSDAGYDVTSKAYVRNAEGRNVATVGHTFLARGSMGGWYAAQLSNEGGAERNLCGSWTVYSAAEMMAFLSGVEMMSRKAEKTA